MTDRRSEIAARFDAAFADKKESVHLAPYEDDIRWLTDATIRVGDVVQIDPGHDAVFGACLLTVTEVKSWGVLGFVRVPAHPTASEAYYRAPFEKIVRIGRSEWAPADDEEGTARSGRASPNEGG